MKLFGLAIGLAWLAATQAGNGRLRRQGEALFSGARPLAGRIRGHESGLPPEVVVCAHCHPRAAPDAGPPAAPNLTRALLLEARPRRGGPPSSYDPSSFCRLVRTGVDPAYVMIDRLMPVYELSDAACASLWEYLAR